MAFRVRSDVGQVFLPSHGRVRPQDILMGEQFRQFVPNLLVEVPDPPLVSALESPQPKPKPLESQDQKEIPMEVSAKKNPEGELLVEEDQQSDSDGTLDGNKPKRAYRRRYR